MTSQAAKRFVGIGEQLPRLGARGNKQTLLAAVVQGLIWAYRKKRASREALFVLAIAATT